MTTQSYFLYLAAVAVLVLLPGPTMLMCITTSLNHGPRASVAAAAGSVSAVLCVMLLSALGLGALLAASEAALNVLKVVGAAYLISLGIKTFRSAASTLEADIGDAAHTANTSSAKRRPHFLRGIAVGASNPKALLFFAAFFPQFLDPAAAFEPQFAILAATFVAFEFTVLAACSLGVARLAPALRSTRVIKAINRVCGGLFTIMGSLLLLTRRHA